MELLYFSYTSVFSEQVLTSVVKISITVFTPTLGLRVVFFIIWTVV